MYPIGTKTAIFDTERAPADYDSYMEAGDVAKMVIDNLRKDNPEVDLFIKNLYLRTSNVRKVNKS